MDELSLHSSFPMIHSKYQNKTRQKARPIHPLSKTCFSYPITAECCQDAQPMIWTRIQLFPIYFSYLVGTEDSDQPLSNQWTLLKNLYRGHHDILFAVKCFEPQSMPLNSWDYKTKPWNAYTLIHCFHISLFPKCLTTFFPSLHPPSSFLRTEEI